MRRKRMRYKQWCVLLASGGVTPGILQGLGLVNWASLFTSILTMWLSALAALLFGGDPFTVLQTSL